MVEIVNLSGQTDPVQPIDDSHAPGDNPAKPGRLGRWLLTGTLFFTYVPMQIVVAIPLVLAAVLSGEITTMEALSTPDNPVLLWMSLIAAAIAGLLTVGAALAWPAVWRFFTERDIKLAEWLAWRPVKLVPLWSIPVVTLAVIVSAGLLASTGFGPTEVDLQVKLFSVPGLGLLTTVVVSTVVPVAEEFIFRGALYSAALGERVTGWRRHIVPFTVTAILFGLVHLLAGFQAAGSIVLIFLLSLYLTALRAVTGSVKSSIVAHLVWNLTAAVTLIVSSQTGLI